MSENDNNDPIPQMREHIKTLESRIKELEPLQEQNAQLKDAVHMAAFKEAGIDPTAGIGKAVFRTYEGDSDPEAILQFAQTEYGFEVKAPTPKATVPEGNQRLAALDAAATPDNPPALDEKIAEAEKSGNFAASLALKAQQLRAISGA